MKVANLGMKWVLGVSSFLALAGSAQSAQYPLYEVRSTGDGYCSIAYQESEGAKVTGVPRAELKRLRKQEHYRERVDAYQPEIKGQHYRTTCDNARALARGLKNAIVPKTEQTGESIACRANNKIYRIHVRGHHASMVVSRISGEILFFGGTESEPSKEIKLKMSRDISGCSVQFSHSGAGLKGFNLCLAEGETSGTLHVNDKNAVLRCEPSPDFHEAVAESLDSEKHPRRKKHAHTAGKDKPRRVKHARPSGKKVDEEAAATATVDPSVEGIEYAPSAGGRSLQ